MRKILLASSLSLAVSLGACGGAASTETSAPSGGAAESSSERVAIAGFAYEPETLEIDSGTTVEWVNEDDIAHTVTSGKPQKQGVPGVSENRDARPDGAFDSGPLELDETFTHTFDEPGAFAYFCAIHPGMVARIQVR